jgi:hypothetical protein
MGGDDSQKLLPWRGTGLLSGAQQTSGYYKLNTLTQHPSVRVAFFWCAAEVPGHLPHTCLPPFCLITAMRLR